ncbi:DUF3883 domain-containing protein [Phenylobacterium sp.]|uniref:protein NO VEIN domain-containing protein n=1 Tax=Phenylobacterium sp. TaxID=1871053 RepID=UPI0025E5AD37|nr:DUF3883 domain-containing protein [Phenylobacterium sp.]MBX3483091.1 DUF3883 domain-containing protein [Phenylobacterium sp.]MCW5758437.1 DUF3883 domain-containing protein [Phenylobacterium sp.]
MRFAVKKLSRSDLTFFEPQFRVQNAGNQKSINLNRDVFVDELFPAFPDVLTEAGGQLAVRLLIDGPGLGHNRIDVRRKLAKGTSYKNYRLNGEFVRNPEEEASRFNSLAEGDLAVLAFDGAGAPELIRLFVLSASEAADVAVRNALVSGGRTMRALSREQLAAAVALAPPDHPLQDLLLSPADAADLEAAAEGDAAATRRLLSKSPRRRITAEQLAAARRRAEETGLDGERLVAAWLGLGQPQVQTWIWVAATNAISPWDFELRTADGDLRVEVKATRGDHETPFHISMAELHAAAETSRYDLWRISGLNEDGGRLRVCIDFGPTARELIDRLKALPDGIRPDGFTVDPVKLSWSEPAALAWPDADEA